METPPSLRGRCGSADSYGHAADVYKDDALRAEDRNQTITVNRHAYTIYVSLMRRNKVETKNAY